MEDDDHDTDNEIALEDDEHDTDNERLPARPNPETGVEASGIAGESKQEIDDDKEGIAAGSFQIVVEVDSDSDSSPKANLPQ